jgi:hypothetical protein
MTATQPVEHVSFNSPDEVREGENWRMELVNLAGGAQVGRMTLQPGWKWSADVKPVAGTDLCMAPHQHAGARRLGGRRRAGSGHRLAGRFSVGGSLIALAA